MFRRVFFALMLCLVMAPAAQAVEPDGALIRLTTGTKWSYRIVGGAPLHITSCAYTNNCEGRKDVPNLAGYRAYPRDGAMIFGGPDGGIYRFAGGAPLWVSSCSYAPTCAARIQVDAGSFTDTAHLKQYPVDGTVIRNATDGGLYRFAGGAPLLVRCDLGAGCTGYTSLDGGTFSKLGTATPASPHLRQFPADNTVVKNSDDNAFYRFAGGAPLPISPQASGQLIDSRTLLQSGTGTAALPHLRPYPAEGTFLNAAGVLYRVAGSAAVQLTNCAVLPGGCPGAVAVEPGTISGLGGGRLLATPKDGTVLRGYPSNALWEIQGGTRRQTFVNVPGIGIDDTAIVTFIPLPATPPPPPGPAAPPAPFEPVITIGYSVNHKGTKFTTLNVRDVPSGSKVSVSCNSRRRGCPFRSKSYSSSVKSGKVNLVNRFKSRRLRSKVVLTVKLTSSTGARKYQYIKIRAMKRPVRSTQCSAPGGKLGKC